MVRLLRRRGPSIPEFTAEDKPELRITLNMEPHPGDVERICQNWFRLHPETFAITLIWPDGECRVTLKDDG